MAKATKFIVTIPDSAVNEAVFNDMDDLIEAASQIAEAIGDLGFDGVSVKEFNI